MCACLLFIGLGLMKSSVAEFSKNISLVDMPNYGIFFYFAVGLLATAIMQASSATVALTLTALNAGLLSFNNAAAMVIGADLGTTVTILIGSIGGGFLKKRVALAQVGFNIITGLGALIFMPLLIRLLTIFIKPVLHPIEALVIFHSVFNVIGVLIFLPFLGKFSKFLEIIVKAKKAMLLNLLMPMQLK